METSLKKRKTKHHRKATLGKKLKLYYSPKFGTEATAILRLYDNSIISVPNPLADVKTAYPVLDPHDFGDWSSFAALYDAYRVVGFKVKWYPATNDNTVSTLGVNGIGYTPIHVAYDVDTDSSNTASSVTAMLDNRSCKTFNLFEPWEYYIKKPVIVNSSLVDVKGLELVNIRGRGACLDTNYPQYYNRGIVMFYVDTPPTGTDGKKLGTIVFESYICFYNRR